MIKVSLENDIAQNNVTGNITYGDDTGANVLPEVNALSLTKTLAAPSNSATGILPPAIRWISGRGDMFAFERPPRIQKLSYHPVVRDAVQDGMAEYTFEIPIPWTVYLVTLSALTTPVEVRVFARNAPLDSMQDKLYLLPIPNIYYNAVLCPPIFEKYEAQEPSIAAATQAAYNLVWNSGFNFDLVDAVMSALQQGLPWADINTIKTQKINGRTRRTWGTKHSKVYSFFSRWSEYNVSEALSLAWPEVSGADRPYIPSSTTLESVISNTRIVRAIQDNYSPRAFIINLINSISSLV